MSIAPLNALERLRATAAVAALRANSASAGQSGPTAARRPDGVTISDSARSLAAAHKAVGDAPDVREDRVSALKAAIADGTYSVDSRTLAARLLEKSDL